DRSYTTPGGGGTPSPTPGGAVTISVSTGTSGASASGYVYTSSAGSNGPDGLLTLTASVGDTIQLPGSGLHPLYFDAGSSTCIYSGSTGNQTYVFPSAGTYYFHCGNHATACGGGGNAACGSTSCTSMAGVVTVN
ncbi:MAG TPA: hypothetical protein VFR02_07790, partial [bacterium]|nr:hypothetical protein [bacterium]